MKKQMAAVLAVLLVVGNGLGAEMSWRLKQLSKDTVDVWVRMLGPDIPVPGSTYRPQSPVVIYKQYGVPAVRDPLSLRYGAPTIQYIMVKIREIDVDAAQNTIPESAVPVYDKMIHRCWNVARTGKTLWHKNLDWAHKAGIIFDSEAALWQTAEGKAAGQKVIRTLAWGRCNRGALHKIAEKHGLLTNE